MKTFLTLVEIVKLIGWIIVLYMLLKNRWALKVNMLYIMLISSGLMLMAIIEGFLTHTYYRLLVRDLSNIVIIISYIVIIVQERKRYRLAKGYRKSKGLKVYE